MQALTLDIMWRSLREVGSVVVLIVLITIALEALLYVLLVRVLKYKYALPFMLLTPAAIGLGMLIVYPILYELTLSFSNMSLNNFKESYTITEEALAKTQADGVPAEVQMQFKGLTEKRFASQEDFLKAVSALIGADQMPQYQEIFLTNVQQTDSTWTFPRRAFLKIRKDLPAEVLTKLDAQKGLIGKTYNSKKEILQDLQQTLTVDQFSQYQATFLKYTLANPGPRFSLQEGINNFTEIFTQPVLKQIHFFPVLWRTILWTAIQVPTHVILGLALAMLLNRPMKLRGLYRTLIVIPWAIPQVIAVLVWRGEFHSQYGFLNIMLRGLGLPGVEWKTDPFWNFVSINLTNFWLGVPFMMVILLGGLQSISQTYYEAADVDGASWWAKFRHITIPQIQPVMTPAIILGVIWTFNNFNVPYLLNQNELESSDILVTALFRAAFEYNRYGFAAAFALVIFVILLAFCLFYMRVVQLDLGLASEKKKKG
jgi:arabinogalactan oligomer / maltooligosaccharide transport system permease protein